MVTFIPINRSAVRLDRSRRHGGIRRMSARFFLLKLQSGDLRVQLGFTLIGLHQDTLRLFLELNHLLGGAR